LREERGPIGDKASEVFSPARRGRGNEKIKERRLYLEFFNGFKDINEKGS